MSTDPLGSGGDCESRQSCVKPEPALHGLRVLVIEDSVLDGKTMERLLRSWCCHITLADGALAAVDQVRRNRAPDFILSDYQLNDGYDGINAIRLVRELTGSQIPACLISSDDDKNVGLQAEAVGLYFLPKSVSPATLRSVLWTLHSSRAGGVLD